MHYREPLLQTILKHSVFWWEHIGLYKIIFFMGLLFVLQNYFLVHVLLYLLSIVFKFFNFFFFYYYLSNHKLNAVHWQHLTKVTYFTQYHDAGCQKFVRSQAVKGFYKVVFCTFLNDTCTTWMDSSQTERRLKPLLAFRGQQRSVGLQLLSDMYTFTRLFLNLTFADFFLFHYKSSL